MILGIHFLLLKARFILLVNNKRITAFAFGSE